MNCDTKIRFKTKEQTVDWIRIVEHGKGLVAYKCNRHLCWHMGHPSNPDNPINRVINILEGETLDEYR